MKKNKRGVSPVIATILLVAIVIVIALIVFMWFRSISEEAITKFDGTNVKLVCEEVSFDASYSEGFVYISNTGNVPVYKIKAKIESEGSYETIVLGESDNSWPQSGLLQGGTYAGEITTAEKILLIPVLIGSTSEGEKAHTCDERHGIEAIIV